MLVIGRLVSRWNGWYSIREGSFRGSIHIMHYCAISPPVPIIAHLSGDDALSDRTGPWHPIDNFTLLIKLIFLQFLTLWDLWL
jgi:hypothetical protein